MIFTSVDFFYFFAALLGVYFITPPRFKWIILLSASYFFYGFLKVEYLVFLVIPTAAVYLAALKVEKALSPGKKRLYLSLGIAVPLGFLFTFKYLDLFVGTFRSLFRAGEYRPLDLILPIGISFYSFKMVSYIVDVYREKMKAEKHPGFFALYVSFFPQLLAGPIDRAVHFLPELKKRVRFDADRICSGLRLITWGFFKKVVIAERMALFVDQVFGEPAQHGGIPLIFGVYFYAFQIYCDFSGYSDIAIGVSRVLGFKAMDNFNFPYFSKNLIQFWNKWHISLSTWLRDYLFLPISYAFLRRVKGDRIFHMKTTAAAYVCGIAVTMFLGGLWHGAAWTFVLWGSLHGLYLAFSHLTKRARKRAVKKLKINRSSGIYHAFQVAVTFHLVCFGWIFFRSSSFQEALAYIGNIHFGLPASGLVHLLYTLFFMVTFIVLEILLKNREKLVFLKKIPGELKLAAYIFFICLIIVFSVDSGNEFIYFQF